MVATDIFLEFSPRNLGKISNLTHIFQLGGSTTNQYTLVVGRSWASSPCYLARSWVLRFGVLAGMHAVEIPVPEMPMMTSPTLKTQGTRNNGVIQWDPCWWDQTMERYFELEAFSIVTVHCLSW